MACGIDTRLAERRIDMAQISDYKPDWSTWGQVPYGYAAISALGESSKINEPKQPKKEKKMLENVKGYVDKHRDIIFTIGLVVLIDHFMFKGALRQRIQGSIEGVLKKVEEKIQKGE